MYNNNVYIQIKDAQKCKTSFDLLSGVSKCRYSKEALLVSVLAVVVAVEWFGLR